MDKIFNKTSIESELNSAGNDSILAVIPQGMIPGSGNLLIDELQVWGGFYQQKFLEKTDRDEIKLLGRRAAKLSILAIVMGGVANRLLTMVKVGKFDFLNMRLVFRLPIRFLIFGLSFTIVVFGPIFDHMYRLREKLTTKYKPRFRRFSVLNDPLIMNPFMLNEPGMTEEEKEYMKVFYDNMKVQMEQMKAQMKMMEEKEKSSKRI